MIQSLTASTMFDGVSLRGPTTVSWENGVVVEVRRATTTDRRDCELVAPGYIDLQVNGIGDDRVAAVGADIARIAGRLRAQGVTTWLPTVPTQEPNFYDHTTVEALLKRTLIPDGLPQALGLHFEGPLLGSRPGAHPAHNFEANEHIIDILEMGRMVTIAPEHPRAHEATSRLAARGVVVSLGHTGACADQVQDFLRNGGRCATHLFNAMTGVDHVSGGVALEVLNELRLHFSMIADLRHVTPAILRLAWRLGKDRMFVVSDQVSDVPATFENTAARLRGAVAGLDEAVRNLVHVCDVPLEDALAMVTRVPAALLGEHDRGVIGTGSRADIVVLDSDLRVQRVVCHGFPSPR